MDIFRIKAMWVDGLSSAPGETIELVAGFTPLAYIAVGNWFGVVNEGSTLHPFVLTDDGYCRYTGGLSEIRYFSIVKRPVKVGEVFELSWADNKDLHSYRITDVQRLNLHPDWPNDEVAPPKISEAILSDTAATPVEARIFIKNELIREVQRPEAFKASVGALIDAGHVVAVGENSVERTFASVEAFAKWFDRVTKP